METPRPTPPRSQVITDDSATNSGYRSPPRSPSDQSASLAAPTPNSSASTALPQEPHVTPTAASLSSHTIQGMKIFQRAVSEELQNRFQDIMRRLSGPLATCLRKSRHEHRPTALRLMFLGHDENSAQPWIVVLCPEPVKKRAEKFLKQDMTQRVYQSDEPGRESFQAVVVGHEPRPKAEESARRVLRMSFGRSATDGSASPRFQSSSKANAEDDGISLLAAIGGYIAVRHSHGREVIYGLTAGHVLPQTAIGSTLSDGPWGGSIPSPDSSDSEEEITSVPGCSTKDRDQSLLESLIGPREEPAWTGMILAEVSFSREARDRDWALIERISATKIKSLYTETRERTVLSSMAEDQQPAQIRLDAEVTLNCTICRNTSMILTPSGQNFVQADILKLDASKSLQDGASGTWVTSPWHRIAGHPVDLPLRPISVYGQVVADDIFGDVYMIPLSDIIEDIETLTGAAAARLPASLKELDKMLSKERGREEADLLGRKKASSSLGTKSSTHEEAERVGLPNFPIYIDEDFHKHDIHVPPPHPKSEEDANALTQNDTDSLMPLPVAALLDSRHHDSSEESYYNDENLHIKYNAPKVDRNRTQVPWTLEEDGRLKELREGGVSWDEITKEFPNRSAGNVKKHWYKDLHHADIGEGSSAPHT